MNEDIPWHSVTSPNALVSRSMPISSTMMMERSDTKTAAENRSCYLVVQPINLPTTVSHVVMYRHHLIYKSVYVIQLPAKYMSIKMTNLRETTAVLTF